MNVDSLQTTQFSCEKCDSLWTTQSGNKHLIRCRRHNSARNIHMCFGSSTQFVIKIQQNHIFSSMNNYMQFSSSTQFLIKIQQSHIFSSMNNYMQFITQYNLAIVQLWPTLFHALFIPFIRFSLLRVLEIYPISSLFSCSPC